MLIGTLVAAVIALVASAAVALGTLDGPSSSRTFGRSMMGGQNQNPGAGMMGGSMMGGQNQNPGAGMMGGSMMGSMGMAWLTGDGVAVSSIPAARARATKASAAAGLRPGEVMWFDNGFYVELKDGAGKPTTEVIVDSRTGEVSTEPGPAMMWNTRFGMHPSGGSAVVGAVDATKARTVATSWLATNRAGTTIAGIDAYPGYFTLDLKRNGVVTGMLSVNSSTGALWYHAWHGAFIAEEES